MTLIETKQNNDIIYYDLIINDCIVKLLYLKSNKIFIVADNNKLKDIDIDYNLLLINMINPSEKELIEIFNKQNRNVKKVNNVYNLNRTTIYNKCYIDFDKIYMEIMSKNKNIKNFELIKRDILSVNQDNNHLHYIKLNVNYELELNIVYNNNIMKKLKDYQIDSIKFLLSLDKVEYPFKVPSLKLLTNVFTNEYIYKLNNLKEFKQINWNPLVSIKYIIEKLAEQIEKTCNEYITNENNNEFNNLVMELALITGEEVDDNLINLEFDKINFIKEKSRWNAGTGYGHEGLSSWDINKYAKDKEENNSKLEYLLIQINGYLKEENLLIINNDILKNYLLKSVIGVNILEIQEKSNLYLEIFKGIDSLYKLKIIKSEDFENKIELLDNLRDLKDSISQILTNIEIENENGLSSILLKINDIIDLILINQVKKINKIEISTDSKENYINMVKQYMFDEYEIPTYYNNFKDTNKLSKQSMIRIMSEIQGFKKNLPVDWDTSILFRYSKKDIQSCSFYVVGPKDTPYHNGIFEFNLFFPHNYPNEAPKVLLLTTGGGTVRFNPNLYNCGKVCLSLLGTWSGQDGEKWNPKISTALQVLISIQSLIFIEEPYFNEPGYERDRNNDKGRKNSKDYNELRRLETLRWGIIDKIKNPPLAIKDFILEHFKMKKEELIITTEKWVEEAIMYKIKMTELRKEMIELII